MYGFLKNPPFFDLSAIISSTKSMLKSMFMNYLVGIYLFIIPSQSFGCSDSMSFEDLENMTWWDLNKGYVHFSLILLSLIFPVILNRFKKVSLKKGYLALALSGLLILFLVIFIEYGGIENYINSIFNKC